MERKINKDKKQITELSYIHPEESGVNKLNKFILNVQNDMMNIDRIEKELSENINTLMSNTVMRLNKVKENINNEKERLQDISMLCNKYTDFDNTMLISKDDFTGNFDCIDSTYTLEKIGSNSIQYNIEDVYGNGYEGNKYVLDKKGYLENKFKTNNRENIKDNSISTYWEYSRINVSGIDSNDLINDFNTNSEDAKCTISLNLKEEANEIKIVSEDKDIMITGIQYSLNNIDFVDYGLNKVISINNKEMSYKDGEYIYGSGIIPIPNCKYVKITFQSNGYKDDIIAFDKKIIDNTNNDKVDTITTVVNSAKRHVIKINDIYCYKKNFKSTSVMKSKELINTEDIYAIALHCNQFIPKELNKDSIEYILTINGVDHKVVPINNSHANGMKVIRFSQGKTPSKYVKYINEEIKSAVLYIKIKGKVNITPYINNIKILLGGEI